MLNCFEQADLTIYKASVILRELSAKNWFNREKIASGHTVGGLKKENSLEVLDFFP